MPLATSYPFLIAFLLFGAWAINQLGPHHQHERARRVALTAVTGAFVIAVLSLIAVLQQGPMTIALYTWLATDNLVITLNLLLDPLSAVMLVLITGISTIVHGYAARYMEGDAGYNRFFAHLSLVTLTISMLVMSGNLLMIIVFWQLVGFSLYLLLNHYQQRDAAVQAANQKFLVNRIGDMAFLLGALLTFWQFGTFDLPTLFAQAQHAKPLAPFTLFGIETFQVESVTLITLLIFIGAMTKSAQFPFHIWLPDTLETPTPVSALMHAGLINAGGFLLARLSPLFGLADFTLTVAFVIGAITALYGTLVMLAQTDIKRTLAYSTMGQMGFMVMQCGLGAFAEAIFHLAMHGLFKATLFLSAGTEIHRAKLDEQQGHRHGLHPASDAHEASHVHHAHAHDAHPHSTTPSPGIVALSVALLLPTMLFIAELIWFDMTSALQPGSGLILLFAWVAAVQAAWSTFRSASLSWLSVTLTAFLLAISIALYLLGIHLFEKLLAPSVYHVTTFHIPIPLVIGVLGAFALLFALLTPVLHGRTVSPLNTWLYVFVLNKGYFDVLYRTRLIQPLQRLGRRLNRTFAFGSYS